jgi:hypothetical protein|tara:strand:+ start:124 stop:471 length:348 start_codon:yes stop_codon:yes gene_type:complete
MTYISIRLKLAKWKRAFIFSLISTVIIALNYINPPSDPRSAGAMFAYNFSFFLPMLGISLIAGFIAVVYLIQFVRDLKHYEIRHKSSRIITILVLLLPLITHLVHLLILIMMPLD